ncbi:MAG: O-succinylbenzoate-CoA ligase [Brevibacillus sp.]|nr:O-succinylbenzoate-CoA ligase [Brevibacillus sp.]
MKGIGAWLPKLCEKDGEKLAVVYKNRRLTYHEFNSRINRLAHAFVELGVSRGDRVVGILPNGNEILEAMFACAKLGAVFVPINFRLSPEEVAYILIDADARLFLHHESYSHLYDTISHRVAVKQVIFVGEPLRSGEYRYEALMGNQADHEPDVEVTEDEVHLMMYTSGTTGRPKGAMLTHANTQWNAIHALLAFSLLETDRSLAVAPLFHIGAMNIFTLPLLYRGGTVVIDDQFEPRRALATIEQEKITCVFMVPAMWLAVMHVPEFESYQLESLRLNLSGGAPTPLTVIEFFQRKGIPFVEGFGLTETAPIVAIVDAPNAVRKNGSVGRAVMHMDVRIADDHGKIVPLGDVGELVVRGPNVMKGYWNKPEESEAALKDGWFHTGDLARIDDEGFLYIVDRKKDMIITGGENVYPVEVEQVLYRHPLIREAAVIGVPDEQWGESVKAIVALKDDTHSLSIEDLRAFCEGKLARFKFPKYLELTSSLPRNATGKVLKTVLRQPQEKSNVTAD